MGIYAYAIILFCTVRASRVHPQEKSVSWRPADLASSMLSKLVYYCQLVILSVAHDTAASCDPPTNLGTELPALCCRWVVNNTRRPISALNN